MSLELKCLQDRSASCSNLLSRHRFCERLVPVHARSTLYLHTKILRTTGSRACSRHVVPESSPRICCSKPLPLKSFWPEPFESWWFPPFCQPVGSSFRRPCISGIPCISCRASPHRGLNRGAWGGSVPHSMDQYPTYSSSPEPELCTSSNSIARACDPNA